ncbi:uncharacterized protein TNCV_1427461 [Trichonephila clavipes]|nr:uncharacterized protein TNCV_1427461 [Trichonephila clavipes]
MYQPLHSGSSEALELERLTRCLQIDSHSHPKFCDLFRVMSKLRMQGRALDWFEVLGYRVVEDKTTDYAHLKQALSEQFPVVRNMSELETRSYSSSQKHNQKPSDFVYDLLKIHKILKLEMTEEKLIDHIISRKIGGKREKTIDMRTIVDHGESSIDLRVKVLWIIRDSMVDAEVVNRIIDSTIKAVDKVVRGIVLSRFRMIETDI